MTSGAENAGVAPPHVSFAVPDALRFDRVSKVYETFASGSRYALRDVSFTLPAGRVVAVVGRSGSGKSTLLHLAAGQPGKGEDRTRHASGRYRPSHPPSTRRARGKPPSAVLHRGFTGAIRG